jgi:hypothetical protein
MHQPAGRDRRLDHVEEADELLVAVALHAPADHRSVQDVERGEERGGAVALVVVGHRRAPAGLHGQPRLGAVQPQALLPVKQIDRGSRSREPRSPIRPPPAVAGLSRVASSLPPLARM